MAGFAFQCTECAARYAEQEVRLVCPACSRLQRPGASLRGVLNVVLDRLPSRWPEGPPTHPLFLEQFLPLGSADGIRDFPVGGTPLRSVPRLRKALSMPRLWVKDDTLNPTGSTKDRASLLVVAKAKAYGLNTVATASTGNAATALAGVAAGLGARAIVFVPASAPEAKLAQMLSYGATVLPVDGTYDDAFDLCCVACERFGWYNRNTGLNPFTVEGKKTVALEIALALSPEIPDVVLVPTGDGVIISGMAKGFADVRDAGLVPRVPRLVAVQPEGAAGIVAALRQDADDVEPVLDAASVADSLTVGVPRNARQCLRRIRESGGGGVTVSDEAMLTAIGRLAGLTGVFAEPAGAAALAGLAVALREGLVERDERVCLLVTGTGLKDVPAALRSVERPAPIAPTLDAVAERIR